MAGLFGKEHKRGVLKGIEGKGGVFGKNTIFFLVTQGNRVGRQLAGTPGAGVPGHGGGRGEGEAGEGNEGDLFPTSAWAGAQRGGGSTAAAVAAALRGSWRWRAARRPIYRPSEAGGRGAVAGGRRPAALRGN